MGTGIFQSQRQVAAAQQKQRTKNKRQTVKKVATSNNQSVKKANADPGVPNLRTVKQALDRKAHREKEKEDRRNKHFQDSINRQLQQTTPLTLEQTFEREAEAAADQGELQSASQDAVAKTWYYRELRQLIDESDILLEVLDARDPLGCRNEQIERAILSSMQSDQSTPKRLILVLNKIDLIPFDALSAWLKYLKQFYPVVAFKSSTQNQSGHLNRRELSSFTQTQLKGESTELNSTMTDELTRSGCLGASTLIQLIKNYSRNLKMKKNLTVGVIGLPNTGKSSLINSLKRAKAVAVGNKPGITKSLQRVKLDNQVTLIDSPGVMWVGKGIKCNEEDKGLFLRNCLRVDQLNDPVEAASQVIQAVSLSELARIYGMEDCDSVKPDAFLPLLAKRMGKLLPGGVPNVEAVSRIVVQDVNSGKIPFHRDPPTAPITSTEEARAEVQVVTGWAKEFDIDALLAGDGDVRVEHEEEEAMED